MKPHRGGLILALGIVSIAVCQIIGFIPWVMGNADLKEMDAGTMDPEGRGLTQAGKICGIVGLGLAAFGMVMAILWVLFVVVLAASAN